MERKKEWKQHCRGCFLRAAFHVVLSIFCGEKDWFLCILNHLSVSLLLILKKKKKNPLSSKILVDFKQIYFLTNLSSIVSRQAWFIRQMPHIVCQLLCWGGEGEGKPKQQKTVTYWYYFCNTLGKIDWFRTNHRKLVNLMSLQRSIFMYLFVTRLNIINIRPCVIGSLADSGFVSACCWGYL